MYYLWLCYLLFYSFGLVFSANNVSVFTNESYLITSFPNIIPDKEGESYIVSSYDKYIYFEFPVVLAPFSIINVYGSQYGSRMFVKYFDNLTINHTIPLLEKFSNYRIELTKKIVKYFPKSGALVVALVLGNKYYLDKEFMAYVQASGLAHLFALSGLHLVIFIAFFLVIGNYIGMSSRIMTIITIFLAFWYLLLGGFGISLQRAFLFYLLWSFFSLIRIPLPSYKIFIIALILNVLLAYRNIFSLSFLLSYTSVFGIIFFYQFWYNSLKRYLGHIISSYLSVSIAAIITVIPILLYVFGFFNLWSVLASTFIVPVMPFVLMVCFIVLLCSHFGFSLNFLDEGLHIFYLIMEYCAELFSTIPYGVIFFSFPKIIAFLWILILMFFMYHIRKEHYE